MEKRDLNQEVNAILQPFSHSLKDVRCHNYDTIMRGIVSSNPSLKKDIELYDAVANRVIEKISTSIRPNVEAHRSNFIGK